MASSDEKVLPEPLQQSINTKKTRDVLPYQSSYDGDVIPQHPDVTTPDTDKIQLAEQLRVNNDIP